MLFVTANYSATRNPLFQQELTLNCLLAIHVWIVDVIVLIISLIKVITQLGLVFGESMLLPRRLTYKSLPLSVAVSEQENSIPLHPMPALTIIPLSITLGLRGLMDTVNKGATYRC